MFAALLGIAIIGCSAPAATGAAGVAQADDSQPEVVARVHGESITLEQVDERIAGTLADLLQQRYDARRGALDELVAQRLVDAEAARRGVETEQLLRDEVDAKTAPPRDEDVAVLYEANKSRFAGQPRELALARVEQALTQRAWAQRRDAFVAELARSAGVEIRLDPPRTEVNVPETAPALGPADAPITVVEFTDYQCPYCRSAQSTVETLLERYGDRLRLVYLDLPLDFHAEAFQASRAARCAGEQGRFWDYHRGLLMDQGGFADADLVQRARALGLDEAAFSQCLASERHAETVRASLAEASRIGVQATPTFFINGRRLSGAQPLEEFVAIIEEELARSTS